MKVQCAFAHRQNALWRLQSGKVVISYVRYRVVLHLARDVNMREIPKILHRRSAMQPKKMSQWVISIVLLIVLAISGIGGPDSARADYLELSRSNRWLTYTDSRYGFSIDYPADWQIIPRDDGTDRYGGVVIFSPMHESAHPTQVAVGLYTLERDPSQNMSDWIAIYQQISSPFPE